MLGVRQADKGQIVFSPIITECVSIIRPDDHNFSLILHKTVIFLAQLRHVRAAERSHEAAIEDQDDIPFAIEIG